MTFDFAAGEYPTIDDYVAAALAAYDGDYESMLGTETADVDGKQFSKVKEEFISEWGSKDDAQEGGVPNISGINRLSDTQVEVVIDGFDATAVYKQAVSITPMHIYGNEDLYDYENNKFGFEFGDMSTVQAQTGTPVGAGPYVFQQYKDRVIYFEANEHYFLGEPKTKYLQFVETDDSDMVAGVQTGRIDIGAPSFSKAIADQIASYNDNGEISGNIIKTITYDNLGYGYIGINAESVNVGGEPGSEASKNLRKGLATILAQQRELAVNSYYGDAASVIEYPISNTSWAAPQPADEGYEVAYSKDVNGEEIYTSGMSEDEAAEAAVNAARGFLEAAGYTFDENGKATAAPEGAKLEYEVIVPAEGKGNHPSFSLVNAARDLFAELGITLHINDPADSGLGCS